VRGRIRGYEHHGGVRRVKDKNDIVQKRHYDMLIGYEDNISTGTGRMRERCPVRVRVKGNVGV
jgi:hypothetical protein